VAATQVSCRLTAWPVCFSLATDAPVREALQKTGLDVAWQPGSVYDNQVARELPLLRAYVHKANIPVQ
jgi:hypothetical protein